MSNAGPRTTKGLRRAQWPRGGRFGGTEDVATIMWRILSGLLVLGLTMGTAQAQSEWELELSLQIEEDLGCKVAFLSHVVDRTVDGRHIVMAKVHCQDRRSFDAYRDDDLELFDFKPCEEPDAKAC